MNRIAMRNLDADERVARFVIRGDAFLLVGDDHTLAFGAHHHLVFGDLKIVHPDHFLVISRSIQRCLVNNVGEIGSGKSGRAAGDHIDIDVFIERYLSRVNLQDAFAAANVRASDDNPAIKAARAKQGRIEHVGAIGRRHQDDAVIGLKTIHLDEKLVERLLAFVMTTAETGTAMASDCIDLIDKNDARSIFLALFEKVADTAGADADKHLYKIRTRYRKERHTCLAGNGLCQERFSGSRRSDHQDALRDLAAEFLKLLRIFEKFDDLLQLFFRLFNAGNLLKGHAFLLVIEQLRLRFAKAQSFISTGLHLAERKDQKSD